MTHFSETLCRHPGFYIIEPSEDKLVFTGEMESYILEGGRYRELFLHIKHPKTILEIISSSHDIRKQAILLNTVDELLNKGLVLKQNGLETKAAYFQPDFSLKPKVFQSHEGRLETHILSEIGDPQYWVQWSGRLRLVEPMGIVITDDYLDPRLSDINRIYMRDKRAWLLVKATGKRPLLGPYFTPNIQGTPCWQCLSYRLIHNQPVRKWIQKVKNETITIPTSYEKETVKQVMAAFLKPAQEFIDRQQNGFLIAADSDNLEFSEHALSVIPQCSCCGNSHGFAPRGGKPIVLNPCPKTGSIDGGDRSVPPHTTIERLQQEISPITGIIGDLSHIPGQKEKNTPIFQTLFYKIPGFQHSPGNNDFMQISLGKGVSEEQSKASALCESIERVAVQYRGDEQKIFSPAQCTELKSILPHELSSFSEKQYRQFSDPWHPESKLPYAVKKYTLQIPINWTSVWSLTDKESFYIPLSYCYANTPPDEERYSLFTSNGCAAGNTLEEAIFQGFLELVERDAVAIWWYNKISRPSVSLSILPEDNIGLFRRTLAEEWDYWVLDLTHDFLIPVMAAIARNKKDTTFRLGFGCHINPVIACQRALTELCQLVAIRIRDPSVFDFSSIIEEPYLKPEKGVEERDVPSFNNVVHTDIKDDILYCVDKAAQLGLKTLVVDYTRPDIPIYTARVIVPGLCHIWPQLGNERLYKIPVTMGWHQTALIEDQLNGLPLLI